MANLPVLIATIGDPDGTRTVTSIIALLVALGVALAMVALWMWRSTRPDLELLGPLEVMGERRWRRSDPVSQRRALDEARPDGAEPLTPRAEAPQLDEAFEAGPTAPGFDDLGGDDEVVGTDRAASAGAGPAGVSPLSFAPPTDADVDTPRQIERPGFDDDAAIDPDVLAAAQAELDAELARAAEPVTVGSDASCSDEVGSERAEPREPEPDGDDPADDATAHAPGGANVDRHEVDRHEVDRHEVDRA